MELTHQLGFMEELLAAPPGSLTTSTWASSFSGGLDHRECFSSGWSFDFSHDASLNPSSTVGFSSAAPPPTEASCFEECAAAFADGYHPFVDGFTVLPQIDTDQILSFPSSDHQCPSMVDHPHDQLPLLSSTSDTQNYNHLHHHHLHLHQTHHHSLEETKSCRVADIEQATTSNSLPVDRSSTVGLCGDKKIRRSNKKLEGQPSKNLMAERRRRKRLNDRLSMLRSIVPKISKMDRTSILGDTIDYMKELLERINKLQEEETELSSSFIELKSNEALIRNSPEFDVERREMDTRIHIYCASKPGLLLSTVSSLEALGFEIQQCVISCFNDFSLQASCSEVAEQRTLSSSEELKQALFRNAGYGGRCL